MARGPWLLSLTFFNLSLAVRSTPILLQDGRLVSSSVWNFHRDLATRLEAFEGENLICQVTEGEQDDGEIASIDFNFWYAMGVDQPLAMMDLLKLEQQLFQAIEKHFLWCWSDGETLEEAQSHNNPGRMLTEADVTRKRFTAEARNLGIIAFSVGGLDEQTSCKSKSLVQCSSLDFSV